ncbi:aldose epimerase family protein [Thalassotalea hakodatensis]|uniref:aldose epimerase family protein n=1 Tax=Thalassotalea hakodatensis TaxID=3030492 RepID=UPI002573D878|nr:aldose epimerase family protein [Thalassotalea hakodatensis]
MTGIFSDSSITEQPFGALSTGEPATLYTLTNKQGMQVNITNYGGIIVSIFTPDITGRLADIVLGYDNVADYEQDTYYLGAIIGRYAGRIAEGKISLDGKQYQLALNAPDSQLHGGPHALNKKLWHAVAKHEHQNTSLTLSYVSPDGENGYPGNVTIKVVYTLDDHNTLSVEYFAETDATTLLNLTQHSYFNLAGHNSGSIAQHQVAINADHFLPMTPTAYPTGEICEVSGTVQDFRQLTSLSKHIDGDDEQVQIAKGFDNYWLVNPDAQTGEHYIAKVVDPASGRTLTLYSDQPSVILYTANYIDGSHTGKNNSRYQQRAALCLEPQRANNMKTGADINNTLLTPNTPFYSKSRYVFSIEA